MDKHRETVEKVISDLTVNRSSPVMVNDKYDTVLIYDSQCSFFYRLIKRLSTSIGRLYQGHM